MWVLGEKGLCGGVMGFVQAGGAGEVSGTRPNPAPGGWCAGSGEVAEGVEGAGAEVRVADGEGVLDEAFAAVGA